MHYLDKLAQLHPVARGVSLQYEVGYRFSPAFTEEGRILYLYEETDASLRSRVKAAFTKDKG